VFKLILVRLSGELPSQYIDQSGQKIELEIPEESIGLAPVRLCLRCNLLDVDLSPCSRSHLYQKKHPKDISNEAPVVRSKWSSPLELLKANSRVKSAKLETAYRRFQNKLSDNEDKNFLKENNVNPGTRLAAQMMNLEENLRDFDVLSSQVQGVGIITGAAKLLKSQVTPAGAYHLALKFGPLVFESGVKR
jgi:hypothetical protein